MYFAPPPERVPLEIGYRRRGQKNYSVGVGATRLNKKFDDIFRYNPPT